MMIIILTIFHFSFPDVIWKTNSENKEEPKVEGLDQVRMAQKDYYLIG
jgi:hypothetical protein